MTRQRWTRDQLLDVLARCTAHAHDGDGHLSPYGPLADESEAWLPSLYLDAEQLLDALGIDFNEVKAK